MILHVEWQEFSCVITRVTVRHLCEIVCTEAEEVCLFCDLSCDKCSTGNFDHGADHIFERMPSVLSLLRCATPSMSCTLILNSSTVPTSGTMTSGSTLNFFLFKLSGGFEDRTCLHLGDFRKHNTQAAATVSEHRVELVQLRNFAVESSTSTPRSLAS